MKNIGLLITTPIKETWSNDVSTLMLGHWCNVYDKQNLIRELKDNSILDYHWNDAKKVFDDYNYLNSLGDKILNELSSNLNKIHNLNYPIDFWKIIIGNWLYTFIHISYDRWKTIEKVFDNFKVDKTKVIRINQEEMIPQSIENFKDLIYQDKWNHFIFYNILDFSFKDNLKFEFIDKIENDNFVRFKKNHLNIGKKFLLTSYLFIKKIYSKLIREDKYLISETYIGKFNEVLLNLKLGNFPLTISPIEDFFVNPNIKQRNNISIDISAKNKFEDFIFNFIPKLIPCSFLENFNKITDITSKIDWPKSPKVIFTSHMINNKTIPSFYVAKKKQEGSKLIHGQHGGGYGQCKFHWYEKFEREISDKYLSWGFKDVNDNKLVPLGIFKPIKDLKNIDKKFNKKKNLLIVIRPKERYFSTALDSKIRGPQILDYHLNCIKILDELGTNIGNENVIIRLHERTYGWGEKNLWKDNCPNVFIDEGFKSINKSISKSKLVIYTYNGTGYLELMASNYPVLLLWSNKDNPLNAETEIFFNELKEAKIFHESKESMSKHINQIWNDVEMWWNDEKVQNIRKKFCTRYVKENKNKIEDLKNIILKSK